MGGLAVTWTGGLVATGAGLLAALCLMGMGFAIRRLRRAEGDVAAMIWAIRSVAWFLFVALLLCLVVSLALGVSVPGFVPALLVVTTIAVAVLAALAVAAGPIHDAWERALHRRAAEAAARRAKLASSRTSPPTPPPPPFPPRPPMPPMPPSGGGL